MLFFIYIYIYSIKCTILFFCLKFKVPRFFLIFFFNNAQVCHLSYNLRLLSDISFIIDILCMISSQGELTFLSGSYMVNWSPNLQTAVSDLVCYFWFHAGIVLSDFLFKVIAFDIHHIAFLSRK